MIFATRQSTEGVISENAIICTFASREHAEAWLLAGSFNGLHPRITVGQFAGRWHHLDPPYDPKQAERLCQPFTLDELQVDKPGEHSGGNTWQFTPLHEVLVLVNE